MECSSNELPFHSAISASNNGVFVVWGEGTDPNFHTNILFKSSATAGSIFDRTISLTNHQGNPGVQSNSPAISSSAS